MRRMPAWKLVPRRRACSATTRDEGIVSQSDVTLSRRRSTDGFAVANELRDGLMVGQLPTAAGDVEQFGIVLDKGSALTRCVSRPSMRFALTARWPRCRTSGSQKREGTRPRLAPVRPRRHRRTGLGGLVPGVLVGAGGWSRDRSRRSRNTVVLKTFRVAAMPAGCRRRRLLGRRLVRRAPRDDHCRGDDRGQPNLSHQPTNLVRRADRCGTRPPSASTRSST